MYDLHLAVSLMDSLTPMWTSSGPRNTAWPPSNPIPVNENRQMYNLHCAAFDKLTDTSLDITRVQNPCLTPKAISADKSVNVGGKDWPVQFHSVQSLDRMGCRGDMRDDSSVILFKFFSFFRWRPLWTYSDVGRVVHSSMLSMQHSFCRARHRPTSKVPGRIQNLIKNRCLKHQRKCLKSKLTGFFFNFSSSGRWTN